MALILIHPRISNFLHSSHFLKPITNCSNSVLILSSSSTNHAFSSIRLVNNCYAMRATPISGESSSSDELGTSLLDEQLLRRVSSAKDADQAVDFIAEARGGVGSGFVSVADCYSIIKAALERKNADLALSVLYAMHSGFNQGTGEQGLSVEQWTWARPDAKTYALLVRGLAASLRVLDAIRMIDYVSCVGVSSWEEVPFGKIVQCPICAVAVAVVQPQQGIQIASCSKCRYQYELISGNIVSIASEDISMDVSAWQKALRFLRIIGGTAPAALHSIVVCTPSGTARTHRFATQTVELPAQEGQRVTVTSAAPTYVYRELGPLRVSAKSPGFSPGEPMCLTNHTTGQVSSLQRAPTKDRNSFFLNPSILFPTLALLATGDAASGFIDPTLPRLISIAAVASVAVGTGINRVVVPQLSKLPQRSVDVVALKQQLLSQYEMVQSRIKDLRNAGEKEVWMLARLCQLDNKIIAIGEPSYRARRARVKRARESLESSLLARIELIESYAKISSMIEIEVEMDSDVLAAEAVSNAESIGEQIKQIMEIENLEERWRIQAEANDEVERLLSSRPVLPEQVETHGSTGASKQL